MLLLCLSQVDLDWSYIISPYFPVCDQLVWDNTYGRVYCSSISHKSFKARLGSLCCRYAILSILFSTFINDSASPLAMGAIVSLFMYKSFF